MWIMRDEMSCLIHEPSVHRNKWVIPDFYFSIYYEVIQSVYDKKRKIHKNHCQWYLMDISKILNATAASLTGLVQMFIDCPS